MYPVTDTSPNGDGPLKLSLECVCNLLHIFMQGEDGGSFFYEHVGGRCKDQKDAQMVSGIRNNVFSCLKVKQVLSVMRIRLIPLLS